MIIRIIIALVLAAASARAGTTTNLFSFDDESIPYRRNVVLHFTPPEKSSANPVLSAGPEGSPDAARAQFYGTVLPVNGRYRMWYSALSDIHTVGNVTTSARLALAESDDGIHWTKPDLGLTEFNGSRRNNLLGMPAGLDFSRIEPLACFVLHEPDDPDPERRYKMAVYGRYYPSPSAPRYPNVAPDNVPSTMYPFFSADGLTWKLAVPMPSKPWFDETEAPIRVRNNFEIGGLFKFDGIYHIAGQELSPDVFLPDGSLTRRTMVTHWSGDFIHWSQDKTYAFQRYGYRGVRRSLEEAHEPAAIWNRGNVLIGIYGLWHGAVITSERRMDLGFLVSNDGLHFREPIPDHVFIPAGPDGAWDQRGLIHGQGFFNSGDTTYIYYGCWDLSGASKRCAVGLATLPRDRFACLSTRDPGDGQFSTKPVQIEGGSALTVNADGLGNDAWFSVEVLDRLGRPIRGFESASLVRTNGFDVPVTWENHPTLPAGSVRLIFHIRGPHPESARFYAAYVTGP